ncbi:MAG: DNA polymerase III subunit delta [Clostridia bacterium]|nr:DNA polymerase III subunit delta [Clostridia bacterium]
MKYVDFKKFTDERGAQPIYLFEGDDAYFREKGEAMLKSTYVQEPTLDFAAFDGASLKGDGIKQLADAWNSFPFISERRMVRVNEFYPTEKDYEAYLKTLFENPPQGGMLVIVNSSKAKTGHAVLSKKPNVTHVDCGRADEETVQKWIRITCKRAGVFADGATCAKISAYCVQDMSRVAGETEKLICYCQATNTQYLTDEIVDLLVYPDAEYKIYELANTIYRKNLGAYTRIANELMTKGFNELALLSSLASYFRNLYEVSILKGGDKEVAATLGIKEYAAKKKREEAAKFGDGLLRIYNDVYTAISDAKCGKITFPSAWKTVTTRLFFGN